MRRADRLFQIIQVMRRSTKPVTADAMAAELAAMPGEWDMMLTLLRVAVQAGARRLYCEPALFEQGEIAIVGDIDEQAMIDAVAATLGALPTRQPAGSVGQDVRPLRFPTDRAIQTVAHDGAADQGLIALAWQGDDGLDQKSMLERDMLAAVLQLRLTDVLREELGAKMNERSDRAASEGTRPRLPWAPRLPAFQKDPTLALPLLDALELRWRGQFGAQAERVFFYSWLRSKLGARLYHHNRQQHGAPLLLVNLSSLPLEPNLWLCAWLASSADISPARAAPPG